MFKSSPAKLDRIARSLTLRADQLDREGKHGRAEVERRKADRLTAKAAAKQTALSA